VQHGSSSLTVTLPVAWTEKLGIKKGDEITMEESGRAIILTTDKEYASDKKEY
jgi:phosphate uptake regulator